MTARRYAVCPRVFWGGIAALACGLFCACGLEDYPYLEQVPPSAVSADYNSATIRLPSANPDEASYFLHFSLYYRVYISEVQIISTIAESQMSGINSSLYSDYSYIKPYTQADNNLAANTGSIFSGRNFFELEGDMGASNSAEWLNTELDKDSCGKTLSLSFADVSPGKAPSLSISGGVAELVLRRSNGTGLFNPQPRKRDGSFDGRFINTDGLNASANATTMINRDVVNKTVAAGTPRYTYACLYICKVGINGNTLTPIYSAPTFIGAFLLPRQFDTEN